MGKGRDWIPKNIAQGCKNRVLINSENVKTNILYDQSAKLEDPNAWHSFYLSGTNSRQRDVVLRVVLDYIYPLDFFPVNFRCRTSTCRFLARNCPEAIKKLCKDNLTIPNPSVPNSPIKFEIILQYSTLSITKFDNLGNISKVLTKLFNNTTKVLDLDNFPANPELKEYCLLSQPRIMRFVLQLVLSFNPICIKLSNNEICTLVPLEILADLKSLEQLDLRNNKIGCDSNIETLGKLNLSELWLDGNPYCNRDELNYVGELRNILPKLEKLDGIALVENGFPLFKKNFLGDPDGFDVVDQFLEYFFPLYDSDRKSLEGLYHPNALFSITYTYKHGQISSNSARFTPYEMNNRNIMTMVYLSENQESLIIGNNCIVKKLLDLPKTEHDPFSFTVDLMHHSENCSIISITGVFKEVPEALSDIERHLGFCRTFVLVGSNFEYSIVNDMLHVYNVLTWQFFSAFTITKPIKQRIIPKSNSDKKRAMHVFKVITGLDTEWARKLLTDEDYDLFNCIKTFMDLYQADKIPLEAFTKTGPVKKATIPDVDKILQTKMKLFKKNLGERIFSNKKWTTWHPILKTAAAAMRTCGNARLYRAKIPFPNGQEIWITIPQDIAY